MRLFFNAVLHFFGDRSILNSKECHPRLLKEGGVIMKKEDNKLYYQEVDAKGNPIGPVKSDLMYQEIDENGKPVGDPKSGITFEVIKEA